MVLFVLNITLFFAQKKSQLKKSKEINDPSKK